MIRQELELPRRAGRAPRRLPRGVDPEITKEALYIRSRHLAYYKEDMYAPIDIEGENYYLKPMNCPMPVRSSAGAPLVPRDAAAAGGVRFPAIATSRRAGCTD